MTKTQKQQSNSDGRKFMNIIHQDISLVLDRFNKVHPFTRAIMKRDLATVVSKRVKQSFKNGIAVGMSRNGKRSNEPTRQNG
jgi:hypothetical protein